MTTPATPSARARKALTVLQAGGFFRRALESGWQGEKFATRLYDAQRRVVAGVGPAAQAELEAAGLLVTRECARSSVWPTEWVTPTATRNAVCPWFFSPDTVVLHTRQQRWQGMCQECFARGPVCRTEGQAAALFDAGTAPTARTPGAPHGL
jgi:hypothetical protein